MIFSFLISNTLHPRQAIGSFCKAYVVVMYDKVILGKFSRTIFTLSIVLVYGLGPLFSMEYEHSHIDAHISNVSDTSHEHHHTHEHESGHHHNHGDGSDEQGPSGDEKDSPSHNHSHLLSFDAQVATFAAVPFAQNVRDIACEDILTEAELCLDGPFYELLKPPQLS